MLPDLTDILRLLRVFYYIGQASILVPVLVGLVRRRTLQPGMRLLFYCCLMWLAFTIFGEYASLAWGNNNGIYQMVDILELWFIGGIYYPALRLPLRRHFLLIGIGYTVLALFDFFVLSGLWQAIVQTLIFHDTYTTLLKHILIIGLVLAYFEQCLFDLQIRSLWQEPLFVVSVGLLLFFIGTIVLFLTDHLVLGPERRLFMLGLAVSNLALNLLVARGLWLGSKPPRPLPVNTTAA